MFEHRACEVAILGLLTNNRQTAFILSSSTGHFTRILLLNERREGMLSTRIHSICYQNMTNQSRAIMTRLHNEHAQTSACTCTHIHTRIRSLRTHTHAHKHTHIHVYTHAHTFTHSYVYNYLQQPTCAHELTRTVYTLISTYTKHGY